MAVTRPFAYNPGPAIPGTTQVGDLAIGVDDLDYSEQPGGVRWWNGPDEELGYVIAHTTPVGNQPNPLGIPAFLGFWRSDVKTEESFISWAEWVSNKDNNPQTFVNGNEAKIWLNNNGYWTSWDELEPSITNPIITEVPDTYISVGNEEYLMFVDGGTTTTTTTASPTTTTTTTTPSGPFSVQFYESGSDVILSFSGQLDLTGLDYVQIFTAAGGGVGPTQGAFGIGPFGDQDVALYTGATFTYPPNFGTGGGGPSGPPLGNGSYFGVFSGVLPTNCLVTPSGYTSGDYIQGTTTLPDCTISSLGMSAGTYTYSWGVGSGQSFDLVIGGVSPTTTTTTTTTGSTTGNYFLVSSYSPAPANGSISFPNHNAGSATLNPNTVGQPGYAIYINRYDILNNDMSSTLDNLIGSNGTLTLTQGSNSVTYSFTDTAFSKDGGYLNQYWWDNQMESSPLNTITLVSGASSDFNDVDPITITVS